MTVLYYFDGRGKAELIRIALCAAKVQFTENLLSTREQFLALKDAGKLMFGQLPLLEVDAKFIIQTNAIIRYIAEKHGLYGKNIDENCRIDMLYEGGRDFYGAFLPIGFMDEAEVLKKAEETTLPKKLPVFEKELENCNCGFLVGDALSIADCSLLEPLLCCLDYFGKAAFKNYPNIQKYLAFLMEDEGIQNYMKNFRKRKNDEKYLADVQNCLGTAPK